MKLSEFDYTLPRELIAQYPAKKRDECRLMVLDRKKRTIAHETFGGITKYFNEGDCLILNDTKVIPGRLFGKRKTGGRVELFLLEKKNPTCEALLRPSGRLKEGEKIMLESGDEVEVLGRGEVGRLVRFERSLEGILNDIGHTPLPPYIDRPDEESDKGDYQTVYGKREGATASPTAGLHFTGELLEQLALKGVRLAHVTLHTNYGTFAPVKADDVEKHRMHKEYFEMPRETLEAIGETKRRGGKIFAVGTTSARTLEHCAFKTADQKGYTDLYIYPGYEFKVVDHLITNFHLPRSTLLLLVSAFAGREFILEAYREAIAKGYGFFSYGDAMLIL